MGVECTALAIIITSVLVIIQIIAVQPITIHLYSTPIQENGCFNFFKYVRSNIDLFPLPKKRHDKCRRQYSQT